MKLDIGYNHDFEVRRERCTVAAGGGFSIAYLSDFHFNKYSGSILRRIIDRLEELNPCVTLLGGDYVDSSAGLAHLDTLMNFLSGRDNVFAIAGNHDYYFGINKIRECITANKAVWLEKASTRFQLDTSTIRIDGNCLQKRGKDADLSILLLHKPIDIKACRENYTLGFAGHLHGCQFVLWQNEKGLYPGRLFYKWNMLKAQNEDCQLLISKGLGDTLPLRYNCKRDMIFVEVVKSYQVSKG